MYKTQRTSCYKRAQQKPLQYQPQQQSAVSLFPVLVWSLLSKKQKKTKKQQKNVHLKYPILRT